MLARASTTSRDRPGHSLLRGFERDPDPLIFVDSHRRTLCTGNFDAQHLRTRLDCLQWIVTARYRGLPSHEFVLATLRLNTDRPQDCGSANALPQETFGTYF